MGCLLVNGLVSRVFLAALRVFLLRLDFIHHWHMQALMTREGTGEARPATSEILQHLAMGAWLFLFFVGICYGFPNMLGVHLGLGLH